MTPERYRHIGDLYHAAMELEPRRRDAFLDEATAGDESLRQEVASLIASAERAGSFIELPAIKLAAALLAEDQSGSLIGQHVGHYKILSLLGCGGMGEVFLAEDTSPLDRKVAIKFLHLRSNADPHSQRRFIREAQAAAELDHPNICAIHEVGRQGEVDFIVMQYVEGRRWRRGSGVNRWRCVSRWRSLPRWPRRWRKRTRTTSFIVTSSPRTSWSPHAGR